MTKPELLKQIEEAHHEGDDYIFYNYHEVDGGVQTRRITSLTTAEIIGRIISSVIVETIMIDQENKMAELKRYER